MQGTAQSLVNAVELVNIFSLTLKPTGLGYAKSEINNVRFERRGADITAHHRIVWSIPETNQHSEFLPWSPLTRPFSHFVIIIAGKGIGRAYALEFMVDEKLYSEWNAPGKSTVEIGITYVFSISFTLSLDADDERIFGGNFCQKWEAT